MGRGRVLVETKSIQQQEVQGETLKKQLRMRHMTMISLGGVIGAGLFVGSGTVIGAVGPAAVLSYLMAGIILLFVMRMLGEMAIARPVAGGQGRGLQRLRAQEAVHGLGEWAHRLPSTGRGLLR